MCTCWNYNLYCICECNKASLSRYISDTIASNDRVKFAKCYELMIEIDNITYLEDNYNLTSNMSCTD